MPQWADGQHAMPPVKWCIGCSEWINHSACNSEDTTQQIFHAYIQEAHYTLKVHMHLSVIYQILNYVKLSNMITFNFLSLNSLIFWRKIFKFFYTLTVSRPPKSYTEGPKQYDILEIMFYLCFLTWFPLFFPHLFFSQWYAHKSQYNMLHYYFSTNIWVTTVKMLKVIN